MKSYFLGINIIFLYKSLFFFKKDQCLDLKIKYWLQLFLVISTKNLMLTFSTSLLFLGTDFIF